jgi:hypothetical protein
MNKILVVAGWGYSMTLNNFYQVIRETKGRAWVKQIGSRCVRDSGYLQGYEVPNVDDKNINFKEYMIIRKENADGSVTYRGKCDLSSTRTLEEVKEGQEFYFNHCD